MQLPTTAPDNDDVPKNPERCIFSEADLQNFVNSKCYKELVQFNRLLSESVKGVRVSDSYPVSDAVQQVVGLLDKLNSWVDLFPPEQQPMRFGNKAYRSWYDKLVEESPKLLEELLPETLKPKVNELMAYWKDSFGNRTRIDYGTGHETCFILFLWCLFKLEYFVPNDCTSLVLSLFNRYIQLMRRMQVEYMLEPAGSHGVWGLDDYQCLVFYYGSSQLIEHSDFLPSSIHRQDVLEAYSDDYLYFAAVKFIQQVKSGSPFAETSPMLNDISGVLHWSKVNRGMLKLYEGEVLQKLPVIQHLRFGTLFSSTWTPSQLPASLPSNTSQLFNQVPMGIANHRVAVPLPDVGVTGMAPWATSGVSSSAVASRSTTLSGKPNSCPMPLKKDSHDDIMDNK